MTKTKELKDMEAKHKATIIANEHWAWLQTLLEKVYKDAFAHGYKHGKEDK